ncbi:uncharacterized protein [Leptinotarsa decemlineata]|uniref:uncharacterized protein n=1 Tax=Leptinotarsa decemlineata TaxID=7539 RepID=UPI003D30AD28
MVLNILGKESPVIVGLGVPAPLDEVDDAEPLPQQPIILTQDPDVPSTSRIGKQKRSMTGQEEIADKRKVKLDLQIEHLKLQNHKTKLEISQLETALNLPSFEFTQSFARDYISYGKDQRTTHLNIEFRKKQ